MNSSPLSTLLKKYNVQGPRYTSYPTVPYWDSSPTQEQWIQSIDKSLSEGRIQGYGSAIYIHIPFCESLCTYCGCNTRITRKKSVSSPYVQTVLKEWALYQDRLGLRETALPVSEIHLGGGTPTFLNPGELIALMEPLLKSVSILEDAEFSIEADPRVTTSDHLKTLFDLGFRRISLGIQDFDLKVQKTVNRVHSEESVKKIVDEARNIGFNSINFDLIYGLPFQSLQTMEETILAVNRLRPDRIAFYSYAHVPWIKPSHRKFTEADLPSPELKRGLYELGRSILQSAEYREVGMDHFALESDSLWKASLNKTLHRNFMGYISRHVSPLIGLGVSAIGDSWTQFAQNEKLLEKYTTLVEEGQIPIVRGHILSEEDQILRRHILDLMTKFETRWQNSANYTPFLEHVPTKLLEMEKDGLIRLEGQSCAITDTGRTFIRNAAMAFDAKLSRNRPDTELFSKTI